MGDLVTTPNRSQLKSVGFVAIRVRMASQLKEKTPRGLPSTNPKNMATVIRLLNSVAVIITPALARANIGRIM